MSIDRGYRPSSALQGVISVYLGTFNRIQCELMLNKLYFYQDVSYKIHVVVT